MNREHIIFFTILTILSIVIIQWIGRRQNYVVSRQLSTVELYAHARLLSVNGTTDPPCSISPNVYVCAGYCPWHNTHHNELVSCSFLPRILHPDFVKYKIYCTPHADHCPTYNAWLKDNLPQADQPIKQIPGHLLSNFTLNYSIPVDSSSLLFRTDHTLPANWTVELIEKYRSQVRAKEAFGSYNNIDIYPALDKYASLAIKDKNCAVIGSENPWIEAALLEYNARSVTTMEYATIYSSVPRLFTITPMEFARKKQIETDQRQLFDSVWSYSSIEHDGLGRYGDPLNAYGDLQTMVKISCILKPGGLLFLALPLNVNDFLQFNLHRIYGPIRLPLLYRNFHIVEVLNQGMAQSKRDTSFQPFVVLQNKIGCKQS